MPDSTSDSREEVMEAANLHELFCERTALDLKPHIEAGGSGFGAVVFVTLTVLFFVADQPALAKGCLAIFLLQVGMLIWMLVVRSPSKSAQLQDDIRRGVFPPESAFIVLARLRWWNHLISPRRWARQSRVYDRRFKLERRMTEARARIATLEAEHSASKTKANDAASAASMALAAKVKTLADRENHLMKLARIEDGLSRLTQEMALYEALLEKIRSVTDMLDHLNDMNATIFDAGLDLSRTVTEGLSVLEERRRIVIELDEIDPDDFLRMITF